MKNRQRKRAWKKVSSFLIVLTLLVSMVPNVLAEGPPSDPPLGGDDSWQGQAGLGGGSVNKKAKDYVHTVIVDVTSITEVETEANANKLNYYIVGATVNGKVVTDGEAAAEATEAIYTGLVTVIDGEGREIAPTLSKDGETIGVSYDEIGEDNKVTVVITDYIQDTVEKTVDEEPGDYLGAMGTEGTSPDMAYRAALYVNDGAVDKDSIPQVIQNHEDEAAFSAGKLKNASITAASSGFSGVIAKTSDSAEKASQITISDSAITLDSSSDGTDVNDFAGYGAAVSSFGGKTLTTIEGSTIITKGVAKSAVFTDTGADLVVKDSELHAAGGEIYDAYELTSATSKMVAPPWVLGVAGNARTSNLMGEGSTATFVDSTITADGWGALSVDNGSDMVMTTVNSTVDTTKVDGDGDKVNGAYGAFGIGSTQEYMYGLDMDVDNYAWVMLGASVDLERSETGKAYTIKNTAGEEVTTVTSTGAGRKTTIDSGNFGFMMSAFGSASNTVNVGDGTEIDTENAVFLYKAGDAAVNIDNASVTSGNNVLFQAIDNEDAIVGDMTKGFSEPEGWSSTWYDGETYQGAFSSSGKTADITIKDAQIAGDIYNGTGYFYTAGGMFASEGIFGAHAVNVSLSGGTQYTGVIASTEIQHGDWTDQSAGAFTANKTISFRDNEGDPYDVARATAGAMKLGHVVNQNFYNGYNDVNVTVSDNAKWVVRGDSMVTDLIVSDRANVTAEQPVTVTVNGLLFLDGALVKENTTVGNVTYKLASAPSGTLTMDVEGLLTLTVNGKEVPLDTTISAGDDAVLTVTNYLQADGETVGKLSGANNGTGRPYRTALFVDDGALVADRSVTAAVQNNGGTAAYGDDSIENVSVSAGSTGFSGIILNQAGEYGVKDTKIVLDTDSDGTDANDFSGYGSAVAVFGDTLATIENTEIETTGVAVSGLVIDGGADAVLKDSTITTHGGTVYKEYRQTAATDTMIVPPWDLGLTGNVRAVNVMGTEGTFTMVDSTINAANWAGVSTDGATRLRVTGINSEIGLADSGYGILSIGAGTQFDLYGVDIDAKTFIGVYMDTSTINIGSSEAKDYDIYDLKEGSATKTHGASEDDQLVTTVTSDKAKGSDLTSETFGFMFNVMMGSGSKTNYLNLGEGVSLKTGNAAFLVKADGANIAVDGAKIQVEDGVLLQAMDNPGESIGMDQTQHLNKTYEEPEGWSSGWAQDVVHGKRNPTDLTLTDTSIEGNVYNGTGYDKDSQGGAKVNVTIGKNAVLTGVMASTEVMHSTDGGKTQNRTITYLDETEGYDYATVRAAAHKLNHVANRAYFNGYNDVNVILKDGGKWVVAGDSVVTDVTAQYEDSITADKAVTVTVYGTLTLGEDTYRYDAESPETNTRTVGNVTYRLAKNDKTQEGGGDSGGGTPGIPGGSGGGFPGGSDGPGYNPPESSTSTKDPGYAHMVIENVSSVKEIKTIPNVNGLENTPTPVGASVTYSASSSGGSGSGGSGSGGSSSGSSGSGSSSASKPSTTTNPDGSVTTVVTSSKGTVTATTMYPDGSKTVQVTNPDGSGNTTTTASNGITAKTETTAAGVTTGTITVPDTASGKAVTIPVKGATGSTVVVMVGGDGTETILKRSVAGDGVITVLVDSSCSIKIRDNAKHFTDTASHWAKSAVDFVSSRELFNGTSATQFSPDVEMSRSMMAAVLYRLEGAAAAGTAPFSDVAGGTWYTDAVTWANTQGIVKGTGTLFEPDRSITRQEIVVMLYRYAKMAKLDTTATSDLAGYSDGGSVSDWASEAMEWAIGSGLINGRTADTLTPSATANRAEVATMLQRLVELMLK